MWITHGWAAIKRVVPIVERSFIIVHIIDSENWFITVFEPNVVGLDLSQIPSKFPDNNLEDDVEFNDLVAADAPGPSTPFHTSTLTLVHDVIKRSIYRLPDDMAKVANVKETMSIRVKLEGGDLHTLDLRVQKSYHLLILLFV
ncbi:hypothetical protein SSX86_010040 [Deinandra increscens subsp. villosa]|uniref:Uncharacterized protein n=1 Tax=Deinandra increscens subsp. villosa TaxID=3103831 RepID=A0AAP0DAA5_9ASTR